MYMSSIFLIMSINGSSRLPCKKVIFTLWLCAFLFAIFKAFLEISVA